MRLQDAVLEDYREGDLEIYMDDEYFHPKWWQSYEGLTFVYSRDKRQEFANSDPCITMRVKGDTEGYLIPRRQILREDEAGFHAYDPLY